jgi:hypothetical protein
MYICICTQYQSAVYRLGASRIDCIHQYLCVCVCMYICICTQYQSAVYPLRASRIDCIHQYLCVCMHMHMHPVPLNAT